MSGRFNNLQGKRFGKIQVIEFAYRKNNSVYWKCKCDCGNELVIVAQSLISGRTKACFSCSHTKHGLTKSRLYMVWAIIKERCYNKKAPNFFDYGGRGITMCDGWKNDFMAFHDWAMANGYKEEVLPNGKNKWTIDRVDVNGNYEPTNCRWVTRQEQNFNKRNSRFLEFEGKKKHLFEWAKEYNIEFSALLYRLQCGMSIKEALTKPINKKRSKEEVKNLHSLVLNDICNGIKLLDIANKYNITVHYVRYIKQKKENK